MDSTCRADPQGYLPLAGLRLFAESAAAESQSDSTLPSGDFFKKGGIHQLVFKIF